LKTKALRPFERSGSPPSDTRVPPAPADINPAKPWQSVASTANSIGCPLNVAQFSCQSRNCSLQQLTVSPGWHFIRHRKWNLQHPRLCAGTVCSIATLPTGYVETDGAGTQNWELLVLLEVLCCVVSWPTVATVLHWEGQVLLAAHARWYVWKCQWFRAAVNTILYCNGSVLLSPLFCIAMVPCCCHHCSVLQWFRAAVTTILYCNGSVPLSPLFCIAMVPCCCHHCSVLQWFRAAVTTVLYCNGSVLLSPLFCIAMVRCCCHHCSVLSICCSYSRNFIITTDLRNCALCLITNREPYEHGVAAKIWC